MKTDPLVKGVHHDGEEQEPGHGNDVTDVREPELIGCVGRVVAFDQIQRHPGSHIPYRRSRPLASFQYPEPEATLLQPFVR